ncbi:uncharacterized protein LOC105202242 [Solenopsis invicta]|uniref:uncharacterized protein LOC105202242 n=1 Tax=Solenopsis invicta TaxID=13686 RepID=UPI000595ACA5|nr:uncharacterized protein LOC105202242 [Solenopsis invicta]
MNFVVFAFILICCHVWAIENITRKNNFGQANKPSVTHSSVIMTNFLERLRPILRTGNSTLGIPIIDPFTAKYMFFNFNDTGNIELETHLSNVKVDGLSLYEIINDDCNLFDMEAEIDLCWQVINVNTSCHMNGNAFGYDVDGNGDVTIAIKNYRFQSKICMELYQGHIQIISMSTNMTMTEFDFHVTGLFNNDKQSTEFSRTISEMVPKVINTDQTFVDNINNYTMQIINEYLSTTSFTDLLNFIE